VNPEEIVADAGTVDLGRFANVSFDDKTPRLSPTRLLLAAVFIVVTIRAAMVFIIAMVENLFSRCFRTKSVAAISRCSRSETLLCESQHRLSSSSLSHFCGKRGRKEEILLSQNKKRRDDARVEVYQCFASFPANRFNKKDCVSPKKKAGEPKHSTDLGLLSTSGGM
jgi:hypothetical protein